MKDFQANVIQLAIEAWRCKKRLVSEGNPLPLVEKAFERFDRVFGEAEIRIVDLIGKEYNDGMDEEVVYFEQDESLSSDRRVISETIRPTIYLEDKIEVHGQIIVSVNKTETA